MKLHFCLASSLLATAFAFQTAPFPKQRLAPLKVGYGTMVGTVDIEESAQRDVYTMQSWAQSFGAQVAPGFELTTMDGNDWSVVTNQYLQAGSPILYVPSQMIISSSAVEREFGGNLVSAEYALTQFDGTAQRLPLFRLMIKILAEHEKGQESPYFPWLNSLPRRFFNGAAMTGTLKQKSTQTH
jgi:hypothetical protein